MSLPKSACRRRSGHSPGQAARGWRATSSTIPTPCAAVTCSISPPAPGWSPSPRPWRAPRSVVAADIDPFSATAVAMNAAANGVALAHTSADLIGADHGWDVVLAGDVFYDRALAEQLTPWFDALTRRGAAVLVGDPGRSYLPQGTARAARSLPDRRDARAGGCRGQAHHRLALRLTLSAARRSIPASNQGRHA